MFSAGGTDLSVVAWKITERGDLSNQESVDDYLTLLENGRDGELFSVFVDNFYYCQIRAQGELSRSKRVIKSIHICKLNMK